MVSNPLHHIFIFLSSLDLTRGAKAIKTYATGIFAYI